MKVEKATHDPAPAEKPKRRRNPWITTLKVVAWSLGVLIVLCAIALWIVVGYFNEERIVKIIEDKSSEYLNADVKIRGLKYTLFSTYPWFDFEIDSLTVVSHAIDDMAAAQKNLLPANADSLAFVKKVKGSVNVRALMKEDIVLRGFEITQPKANVVIVNDSLSNFNILKKQPETSKVPSVSFDEIKVIAPVDLSFFSLKDDIEAEVEINGMDFKEKGNDYHIAFNGMVEGRYKEYPLPGKVPLKFETDINLSLPDYDVKLKDLYLALAGIGLQVDGEVKADPAGIDLEKAHLNVKIDDLFDLMKYLPQALASQIKIPEGLSGFLPMLIDVNLNGPYKFKIEDFENLAIDRLPKFLASLRIDNASLEFNPPKGQKVLADNIYLDAVLNFDPKGGVENTLELREIKLQGEGIDLSGHAFIDNLLGKDQMVDLAFSLSSPLMETLSYLMPNSGVNISGHINGNVEVKGQALEMGKKGFKNLAVKGDFESRALTMKSKSAGTFHLRNFVANYEGRIPAYPLKDYQGTKLAFDIEADTVTAKTSAINLLITDFQTYLNALDTVSGTPDPYGDFRFNAGKFSVSNGATQFRAGNVELNMSGRLNSSSPSYSEVPIDMNADSEIISRRIAHTPIEVEYDEGGMVSTIMSMVNVNADLSMAEGQFKSPAYLYPVSFSGLNLTTNLTDVDLSAKNVVIARTAFDVDAKIGGLKPFLTSYSPTLLTATGDIDFNDVDINQLSWGYYGALLKQGVKDVYALPDMKPYTAADSVCVLIPRNILADFRLRSKAAQYMGFNFSPLSTQIIVRDGVATLKNLTVGTPYCTAVVDWTYSTAQLDDIYMNLKARVDNFRFSNFYDSFPQLVKKAPELENFTGVLNLGVDCNFRMFPSMFMNAESLKGKFNLDGSDLQFAREGKIQKITHLMLIEGDAPIAIDNLNITGGYHDNLLQVNPFKIGFDDYELVIGGVNNTSGKMYYHLALEKSPFHLPFGVSLFGDMSHPSVKVGGTRIDDYKAEMVGSEEESKIDVNIMAWLKHGWQIFLQQAAKYEQNGK